MTRPALSIETTIGRRPDDVWAALTDWDQAHRWMPGIEVMTAHGETAVGTELAFRARGKDRDSTIARLDPGRSVTLRSVQGGVTADYAYGLVPVGDDATKVTLVATCHTQGALWGAIAPLLRVAMRRADGSQLARLKHLVEAQVS